MLAKLDALYEAGLVEIHPDAAWPTPVRFLDNQRRQRTEAADPRDVGGG